MSLTVGSVEPPCVAPVEQILGVLVTAPGPSGNPGDIIAEALRRPVTITQRNKPRLVLLSIEDYRRVTTRADTRKAGRLETMPDALFEDIKGAVATYEQEGDEA